MQIGAETLRRIRVRLIRSAEEQCRRNEMGGKETPLTIPYSSVASSRDPDRRERRNHKLQCELQPYIGCGAGRVLCTRIRCESHCPWTYASAFRLGHFQGGERGAIPAIENRKYP